MNDAGVQIEAWIAKRANAAIQVQTLGGFQVWRAGRLVSPKEWGRDKTLQLFQFLVTSRHHRGLQKEQIIDRLWEEMDGKAGDQQFKVALHGVNKVLEPERKSREEARFIVRQGLTYQLNLPEIWIDADALEQFIAIGNRTLATDPGLAREAYLEAISLQHGIYLPDRLYEDWSSSERERLQVLALGAYISFGEMMIEENAMESVRLAELALLIDPTWEDAYRLEMKAYQHKGNRPMAIKSYQKCEKVLEREFGIEPLPETKKLLQQIKAI